MNYFFKWFRKIIDGFPKVGRSFLAFVENLWKTEEVPISASSTGKTAPFDSIGTNEMEHTILYVGAVIGAKIAYNGSSCF